MKANKLLNEVSESIYSLLVRSEEKKRAIFEPIIYGLIIVSAIAAIMEFAGQPDALPIASLPGSTPV